MRNKKYTIQLPSYPAAFYQKVADNTGFPVERVLADVLFKMAGELSMKLLREDGIEIEDIEMSMQDLKESGIELPEL